MPTYAYACTTCEHRFEVRQSFSDAAVTECPECAGKVRKLFNTVGIVFKGSGFYRTDSRANGKKDSGGSSDGSKESGSKESSKESGSKPAAKGSAAKGDTSKGSASKGSASKGSGSTSSAGTSSAA